MQRVVTPLGFELCPLDIRQVRGCLISLLVNASINVGVSAASDDRPSRSVALCGLVFICLRWGQGSTSRVVPEVLLAGILVVKKNLPVLAPA